jgi:deazaflavin-dependent oxidoreductase (nitroreductase family)
VTDNEWNRENAQIIEEFRANGGKVGGRFEGGTMVILHTTGARTGETRLNPLRYQPYGDNLVVFASKRGEPSHPDWYHNLVANPRAAVEVGTDTFEVDARVAEGEERERLWMRQTEEYPNFAEYQEMTNRQIPVVVLEPVR